jgi:hypothetical protein
LFQHDEDVDIFIYHLRLNSCRPKPGMSEVMELKQKRICLSTLNVRLVMEICKICYFPDQSRLPEDR